MFSEGNESELLPLHLDKPSTSTPSASSLNPKLRSYGSFKPLWLFVRSAFSFSSVHHQVK